jgi:1,2-diacylglycerol 3-beta-galactosyltransferase
MEKKDFNILILTGDAGLGHRSAAEAVRDAIKRKFGQSCKIKIDNPFNHPDIPDFIRESQSDYDNVVKEMPEIYEFAYDISDSKFPVTLMEGGFTIILFQVLKEILDEFRPDLVITTYPIYPAPLAVISQVENLSFPWITVVTDLVTVHHVWFNNNATFCTVPTKAVKELAINAGFKKQQIINTGIPVNPRISSLKKVEKEALRKELGWEKDMTTLLVVGSPRVTALMDIIKALDQTKHKIQFALVAGGDDTLYSNFKGVPLNHPANVYNFVDNLPEMMRAADLIICKAGGLIVTESLASGLPIMLVHLLPGQEEGNVEYVIEHKAGAFCEKPEEAALTLSDWLKNDGKALRKIAKNSSKTGRPKAAQKIAEKAWGLLNW